MGLYPWSRAAADEERFRGYVLDLADVFTKAQGAAAARYWGRARQPGDDD